MIDVVVVGVVKVFDVVGVVSMVGKNFARKRNVARIIEPTIPIIIKIITVFFILDASVSTTGADTFISLSEQYIKYE